VGVVVSVVVGVSVGVGLDGDGDGDDRRPATTTDGLRFELDAAAEVHAPWSSAAGHLAPPA
jgi:hypothetical protein